MVETENTAPEVIPAQPGKRRDTDDSRDPATVEDRFNNLVVVNDPDDDALLTPQERAERDKEEAEEEADETEPAPET